MPSYKLTYFNVKGRGQIARMLFNMANVEFEDYRVPSGTWESIKPTTPFGFLPVLTLGDGYALSDAAAINRFLAREFGFMGATNQEAGIIEMIMGTCIDTMKALFATSRPDEAEKAQAKADFIAKDRTKFLEFLEKQYGGKDWLVGGNKASLGDVAVYDVLDLMVGMLGKEETFRSCSFAEALCNRVRSIPTLQGYLVRVAERGNQTLNGGLW